MTFLGLTVRQPFVNAQDLPDPTCRLLRELEREAFAPGERLAADDFLQMVARRMPYLDRGRMFSNYAATLGHAPSVRRVSPLLSFALGQLHAEGWITLLVSGDSANVVTLSGAEGMTPSAFDAVVVNVEAAA